MRNKKDIFHSNHIDSNIKEEKLRQIKDLYVYYHKITWIYKHSHKRNKKISYAVNISSVGQRRGNNSWYNITPNCSRYFKNCRYTIKKLS